jgi:hypothetical protein
LAGECPVWGWWWRESKKAKKPFKQPGTYKTCAIIACFLIDLKIANNTVFYLKVLNKIYSPDIF